MNQKIKEFLIDDSSIIEIAKTNLPIENINVWQGKKDKVGVYVKKDIYKTVPKARKKNLKVAVIYNGPIQAPINKDDILGKLIVSYKNETIEEYNLFAFEDVKRLNIISRLIKSINFLIWGNV